MIYGLYLSATGIMTNSYRQDVIANNLANVETGGFKRAMAVFQERPPEAAVDPSRRSGNPLLDRIGGGRLASPTAFDHGQGGIEPTGNPLDMALQGRGYFGVATPGGPMLTRNGSFYINPAGTLVTADDAALPVLGPDRQPINLAGHAATDLSVSPDGVISAGGLEVARVGTFDVPDLTGLEPVGGNRFRPASPDAPDALRPAPALIRGGAVERSNVDATVEMTRLIDAQRQLEANATLLKIQDSTLGKLVNEAARIA